MLFFQKQSFCQKRYQIFCKLSEEIILGDPVMKWAFSSIRSGITLKSWLIIALLCLTSLQAQDFSENIQISSSTCLKLSRLKLRLNLKKHDENKNKNTKAWWNLKIQIRNISKRWKSMVKLQKLPFVIWTQSPAEKCKWPETETVFPTLSKTDLACPHN